MVNTLPSACLRRGSRDPWFFSRQRPSNVSNTPATINRQQRKGFRHHCSPRASVRQTERFLAPPAPVRISMSCALALAVAHPMEERQWACGVFEDTPAMECTTLDSVTCPMISLPPTGFPCGDLACQARSTPAASPGARAGAARVSHPPRTRSSAR